MLHVMTQTLKPANSFVLLMFTQTSIDLPNSEMDELDRYLADSCIPMDDPLAWWLMNRKVYPNLAKLAISIHTCMGTSTDLYPYLSY